MKIGAREIGRNYSPYFIAEIGVNHDGSVDRALALVDAAADAGADAVKMQYFVTDMLMSGAAALASYQQAAGESDPRAMLRRLELSDDELGAVAQRARKRGLHAIMTVFSVELVERACRLPIDAFKTASPDVTHRPLLWALAQSQRPLIVSTGAANMDEVLRAREWLRGVDALFLQCVSAYPTEPRCAALGGIGALAAALKSDIGYSDHTPLVESGALAVAAGACALEKHLTYDRAARGPDHSASLDPEQFGRYVRLARSAHDMLGSQFKSVQPIEEDVRRVSRQSIVAKRDIEPDQRIVQHDVTFKRPGVGFAPWQLEEVLGRTATRRISADTHLSPEDLR